MNLRKYLKFSSLLVLRKSTKGRERLLVCYHSIPAEQSRTGIKKKREVSSIIPAASWWISQWLIVATSNWNNHISEKKKKSIWSLKYICLKMYCCDIIELLKRRYKDLHAKLKGMWLPKSLQHLVLRLKNSPLTVKISSSPYTSPLIFLRTFLLKESLLYREHSIM